MPRVHHSAICTTDMEASLGFWRDGLGFEVLMDHPFDGDWPTLFGASSTRLRSVFLGDPTHPNDGIVELVDFGTSMTDSAASPQPTKGFFLVSIFTDLDTAVARLAELRLDAGLRRIEVTGVAMATVSDPNGVLVELIDTTRAGQGAG